MKVLPVIAAVYVASSSDPVTAAIGWCIGIVIAIAIIIWLDGKAKF